MRKIVAGLFVSLDGVTDSPENWTFPFFNDEIGQAIGAQMATSDAMLLGRRTYEEFARYWPDADAPFAAYMNETPKFVVSTTLTSADWRNSTILRGDPAEAIGALKREPGKDISITGSVTLVNSLLRVGLVDELRLLLYPIVVGSGKRLFETSDHTAMKLLDSTTFGTGVVSLIYEPVVEGTETP